MSAVRALTRKWTVGRYTCTLSAPAGASGTATAVIEWTPSVPKRLTAAEWAEYRAGRNAAAASLAAELGGAAVVVEL
jgi:hypothetical protein